VSLHAGTALAEGVAVRPSFVSVLLALILALGSGCGGGFHSAASPRTAASRDVASSHRHHGRSHARGGRGGCLGRSIVGVLLGPFLAALITAPFCSRRRRHDDAPRPPTHCEKRLREWMDIHQDPGEKPPYHLRCGPNGEGPGAHLQAAPTPPRDRFFSPL
jgi:hypothetical protein